jgi:hypothetical protein
MKFINDYLDDLAAKEVVQKELDELLLKRKELDDRIKVIENSDAMTEFYVPETEISECIYLDKDTTLCLDVTLIGGENYSIAKPVSLISTEGSFELIDQGITQSNLFILHYILNNVRKNMVDINAIKFDGSIKHELLAICQTKITLGMFTVEKDNILISVINKFKDTYKDYSLTYKIDIVINLKQFR